MSRPLVAEIDAAALRHNLERAREAAPGRPLVAIVKADGYGHGLIRVARALASAEAFGVACIEEALQLREAGYQHPILLLEGFFDGAELELVATQRLIAVIHHEWQLKALERASLSSAVRVWLKVDTGMHRLGLPPHEVDAAHLEENGRITFMFCSFGEKPLILKLYGRGRVIRPREPAWQEWHSHFPAMPGERQIILMALQSAQTSCGYGVPVVEGSLRERETLRRWAEKKGEEGIRQYWERNNLTSIDGLPTHLLDDE